MSDPGGPNRKSTESRTFCTLALPNRPSRTFAYVYDDLPVLGAPNTLLALLGAPELFTSPLGAKGPDPLTEATGSQGR